MKILIVCEAFYPTQDATPAIMKRICDFLVNQGYSVSVVNHNPRLSVSSVQSIDGISVHSCNKRISKSNVLTYIRNEKHFVVKLSLVILLIKSLILRLIGKTELMRQNIRAFYTTQSIVDILNKDSFDAIISVSHPFTMHWATYKSIKNRKIQFYTYSFDPYFSNVYKRDVVLQAIALENKVCRRADKILCLDLIARDYLQSRLKKYMNKIEVMEFPTVIKKIAKPQVNDICLDDKYINLTFVGYFYPDIRNPKLLLDMLCEVQMSGIKLNVVGGSYGDFEPGYWEYYRERLGKRLQFYGVVDQQRVINVMLSSDILVNFGNTIANQMPSKIFEYISTGKPIINIHKLVNCPTLKYFERYPIVFNIFDSGKYNVDMLNNLSQFCRSNQTVNISFSSIADNFADCTPDAFLTRFLTLIAN